MKKPHHIPYTHTHTTRTKHLWCRKDKMMREKAGEEGSEFERFKALRSGDQEEGHLKERGSSQATCFYPFSCSTKQ